MRQLFIQGLRLWMGRLAIVLAVAPVLYLLNAGCGSAQIRLGPPIEPTVELTVVPYTLENTLDWDGTLGGADSWNVYWRVDAEPAGTVEGVTPPYIHQGLSNAGVDYCYSVAPVVDGQVGERSQEVCGMPDTVGIPDDTFADTGMVVNDLGDAFDEIGYGVRTDEEGLIVVVGYEFGGDAGTNMALWRYLVDGTPDASFGTDGIVTYDVGSPDKIWDGNALAIDGEGRILVPGFTNDAAGVFTATLWRYDADGVLDDTFDGDGIYKYANPHPAPLGNYDWMYDVAIDDEGRIVVTGIIFFSGDWLLHMSIWRFLEDGSMDPAFNGGVPVDYIGAGSGSDYGFAMVLDGQGRIVVGGASMDGVWPKSRVALWRYLEDGSIDPAFNGGAPFIMSKVAGDTEDAIRVLAIDLDGRILAAGSRNNSSGGNDFCVWRFLDDGLLDPTFGDAGEIRYDAGAEDEDIAYGIAEDVHGRVVVGGEMGDVAVVRRYLEDGTPDPDFGVNGVFTYFGGNGFDAAGSIFIDSLGRILTTGQHENSLGDMDMAIWRDK